MSLCFFHENSCAMSWDFKIKLGIPGFVKIPDEIIMRIKSQRTIRIWQSRLSEFVLKR